MVQNGRKLFRRQIILYLLILLIRHSRKVFSFETVHAGYVKIVATKLFSTSNMWTGWQTVYLMQFAEMCVYKK